MNKPISVATEAKEGSMTLSSQGLANAWYTEESHWNRERDHVVATTWAGLGFSCDIPNVGDTTPVSFMGLPLLMLRDEGSHIRVFHNVCSHRGMQLVVEPGNNGVMIRCPYHRWGYDLGGQLKTTPNIGGMGVHEVPGFDCLDHGLKEVRCEESMGIVFINLSGDAPALAHHLQPMLDRWQALAGPEFDQLLAADSESGHLELTVESNYKLAIENYCEAYHLPFIHPDLNTYSPLSNHYNLVVEPLASGQGTRTYDLTRGNQAPLPVFPAWSQTQIKTGEYLSLYPNVLLGIQADHFFAIILLPEAANKTRERLQLMYAGEAALGEAYAERRRNLLEAWSIVFAEDVSVVEGMQRGRASPGFSGGVFSPVLDIPTQHFHNWFSQRLPAQ